MRASDWLQIGQIWIKPASSSAHSAPHAVLATTAAADAAAADADAALGVISVQGGVLLLPCRLQVAGRRSRLLHVDACCHASINPQLLPSVSARLRLV